MSARRLVGAYAMLATAVAVAFAAGVLDGGYRAVERSDYMTYQVAARIVLDGDGSCLYDADCQADVQRELIGEEPSFERGALPYNSPPWLAAILAPIGALPLHLGFALFTLAGLAVLAAATWRLGAGPLPGGTTPALAGRGAGVLGAVLVLTTWPTVMGAIRGQSTLLVTGLLGLSIALPTYRSGAALGLAALKPTLAPLWATWQVVRWHPRALITAVAVLGGLVALALVAVSPRAVLDYPGHLLGVAGAEAVGVRPEQMINWRGAAQRLDAGGWFIATGSALTLAAVALVWLRTESRALGAAAAFLATPLVIPHANQHEAVLAALGVLLVIRAAPISGERRWLAIAAIGLHAVLWTGPVLSAEASAWLLFAAMIGWLALVARVAWHRTP